jgi:hypothetical protein
VAACRGAGRLDEADVERVLGDPVLDGFGIRDRQARLHLRKLRLEIAQHLRQQEFRDRGARPDQQQPPDLARHLLQPQIELRREREDLLGVLEHELASRRERVAAVPALEQPRVEMLLELLHLERDRRLRHEERLGRLGETQVLRHRVKDLQSPVGHG